MSTVKCDKTCNKCCPQNKVKEKCNKTCGKCCRKIFNDPIHGAMQLHPACVAIINTPQFERLRHIKQLGMCYYVYPGASHNRLEHSIGVCYLAEKFVRILQRNQPELEIKEKDILCVAIAGLCHDLGHGPFSHVFDQVFIPKFSGNENWKHEKASVQMLRHLISANKLMEPGEKGILSKYGLKKKDITFIAELIDGDQNTQTGQSEFLYEQWPYEGRKEDKAFLYEIISNKRNGIDVDKWDYLARDSLYLGIPSTFDYKRFMKFARVIKERGPRDKEATLQICIRDKEIYNLYDMFFTRFKLHKSAYQHRVTKTIEMMLATALFKANEELTFEDSEGLERKMSDCIHDMVAYSKLTDNVLLRILDSKSESNEMREAKDLIQSILSRDLYQLVYESGSLEPIAETREEGPKIISDIIEEFDKNNAPSRDKYKKEDIEIQFQMLDFGMKKKDPVKNLLVYKKRKQ